MLGNFSGSPILDVSILSTLFLIAYIVANTVQEKRRIYRQGGHADSCQTKFPFGIDFVYDAASSHLQHKDILFWERLLRQHGNPHRPYTVEVNAAGRRLIYTADPDNIKAVLTDQFEDYGKGRWLSKEWRALFGHSILATDGAVWKKGRQMIRAQFSKDHISDFGTLEQYAQQVVSSLVEANGNAVDVAALFSKFTLDHGTRFLLGESTSTMRGNEEGIRFGNALDECQKFVMLQATTGKIGKLMSKNKFHKDLAIVNEFVDSVVKRALDLSPSDLADAKAQNSFNLAHSLIESTRDPIMLRDQLLAVLIGARDTTACCLSWLFYSLSQNPVVLKELRDEICSTIGTDRPPTYTEMKDMSYLQNTIKETLRLYPSVPIDIRWALKDTSLPRGGGADGTERFGVLESTPIIYSIQYLHMCEDFHEAASSDLPDPTTFDPKRWKTWHPKHWTYLPFNGGPRLCVGQQFALNEIAYVVVRILQQFESVSWMGGPDSAYQDPSITGKTAVERFLQAQQMPMHSEIVLAPDGKMNLAFA